MKTVIGLFALPGVGPFLGTGALVTTARDYFYVRAGESVLDMAR
jgi:hypothetical protein